MDGEKIISALDKLETKLKAMDEKADGQIKETGKIATETKSALDSLGNQQKEFADRLLKLEQKGLLPPTDATKNEDTWGAQLIKAESLKAFQQGSTSKCRIEVKNTLTGSDTTVAPDRKPGIVAGAFQPLTLESFLLSLPTTSNAIEFTRENTFTNNAAETAEGAAKPESAITFSLINMPISTVAHWIKISKQLAADNPALAVYVNTRMRYGVNRKVETQLVSGDGTSPNISGILDAGNFTAHGYADAALGTVLKKLVLIRKIMADLTAAGYPPDGILLNPVDWAAIEIDLLTTQAGQVLLRYDELGNPRLWGLPVLQSVGMTADQVAVGAFAQAYMVHNRQDVIVELSDSDGDNFTKNLVTVRAERRLALATEVPAACRAGDLTPA